jgi:hypothetical protein
MGYRLNCELFPIPSTDGITASLPFGVADRVGHRIALCMGNFGVYGECIEVMARSGSERRPG